MDIALKIYWSRSVIAKKVFLQHVPLPALHIFRFQILSNFVIIKSLVTLFTNYDALNQRDYRAQAQARRPIIALH